jgi:hypothetical protein
MSKIKAIREELQALIPELPKNWADMVSQETGISKPVIYHYISGRRGKRYNEKLMVIYQQMKTLHQKIQKEIEQVTA